MIGHGLPTGLRRSALLLFVAASLASAGCGLGAEEGERAEAPVVNMTGTWSSLFGGGTAGGASSIVVTLTQNGQVVTGSYASTPGAPTSVSPGTLTGSLEGTTVRGTWSDAQSFSGPFTWNVSPDGRSFAGTWSSRNLGGTWTGNRQN